jgi:hypothetical protein
MKLTGIIGVIAVTFIVIIIAALTYAHVESIREGQNEKKDLFIEGFLVEIQQNQPITLNDKSVTVYTVTLSDPLDLENKTDYVMIFEDTYPPHPEIILKFYYESIKQNDVNYFWITHIEQKD